MQGNQNIEPRHTRNGTRIGGLVVLISALGASSPARILYVSPSGTHDLTPGIEFSSWAGAATNIQAAVDKAAASGDEIRVANATYALRAQITVAKGVTIRSDRDGQLDRGGTIIDGNYPVTTNRCFSVDHVDAVIQGFTITNGYVAGGEVGGGVKLLNGTVRDCVIAGCTSEASGGGVYLHNGAMLRDSTIEYNTCSHVKDANYGGGGIYMRNNARAESCIIRGNVAISIGAGIGIFSGSPAVRNCLIVGNTGMANAVGGGVGLTGASQAVLENCTIVGNTDPHSGGGIFNNNGTNVVVYNSIVYSNSAIAIPGWSDYAPSTLWNGYGLSTVWFQHSCIGRAQSIAGAGNLSANPMFVHAEAENYRIIATSPCRNSGIWRAWMTGATDLDGRPRVDETVDIGAYEYIRAGSVITVR